MKNVLVVLALTLAIVPFGFCQTEPVEYFLIEGLNLEELNDQDVQLIKSSLKKYHSSTRASEKAAALNEIVESCYDELVWPKYNVVLKEFVEQSLKEELSKKDQKSLELCLADAINNEGLLFDLGGQLKSAMDSYFEARKIYRKWGHQAGEATSLNNIGAIYLSIGDNKKSIIYFKKSLAIREAQGDSLKTASSLTNLGNIYFQDENFDKAESYFQRAYNINTSIGNQGGIGNNLYQLGRIAMMNEVYAKAEQLFKESRAINNELGHIESYAKAGVSLALLKMEMGQRSEAMRYLLESRKIADEYKFAGLRSSIASWLIPVYEEQRNYVAANKEYRVYFSLQDSLSNIKASETAVREEEKIKFNQQMLRDSLTYAANERLMDSELDRKQARIDQSKLQTQAVSIALVCVIVVALIIALSLIINRRSKRKIKEQRDIIESEKQESDRLLLNILPSETAMELKELGRSEPKPYEMVSVLFADIHGFTKIAEQMSPINLVDELNYCFTAFDTILERYEVEKIKTIGDAYMAAGGIPVEDPSNPERTLRAALAMRDFMNDYKRIRISQNLPYFEIRLGVHTGPVVAGIVGRKKFAYDIWGDTVNTAARMESSGSPGSVNVSKATYELTHDIFSFEYRGKVPAKHKGEVDMYFADWISEADADTIVRRAQSA